MIGKARGKTEIVSHNDHQHAGVGSGAQALHDVDLVARVELPGGVTVRLAYHAGVLSAAGGPFGAVPVVVPFALAPVDDADEVA